MIIIQLLKDAKYPANYQIIIDSSLGNYAVLREFFSALHEGHGRPRSVRKSCRLRWKYHLPSCSCSPASNRPHSAEKSTPVWLAIWHIWAGFANSQLRCANFCSNYSYKCSSPLLPHWAAARTQQISRPICTDCLRHLRISAG